MNVEKIVSPTGNSQEIERNMRLEVYIMDFTWN